MEDVGDCGCSCEVFDIVTFILIFLLDKISCCNIEIGKKYLWKFRMSFGLVMSIVEFSAICIANKDNYLDDDVRKGLFGFIICFICIAYCVLLIGCENIIVHMRLYKSCDVAMDGLLLAYNYAIDGSATEPFSIICTVVGVLDMSIALLEIFCCGQISCLKTNTSDTESNNSTNPNNNSEQRIENRRNIYHVPHNSMGHTTNYSHQYYTHHGNGIQQGFGNGMQQEFGNGMQQGFGNSMQQGFGNSMQQGFGNGMQQGFGNGMQQSFGNGMQQGFGNGMWQGFGNGMQQSFGNGMWQGFGNGMQQGFGNGMWQSSGIGMQQGFGNGMQHQYPAYQTVPQNTRPLHQNIIIVSQAPQ